MFFEEKKGVKAVRVALAVAACTTFAGAHAQSSTDQQPQQVLITGSNIKTLDVETASPVQVVTRADIQRQGATNIADLINNLAASTGSVLNDIGGSNSFAPGATNVSFRNLGEQSTLVLLNGRRLPSYALADFTSVFVNVDAIPLDAVERVEVLKVGASAIYGSDAVAGVINIITRKDFEGVEVSADRTHSLQSGDFGTSKASITGGFGDYDKDGYNLMFNADFYKRDNVMWTNLLGYTNPALTKTSPGFGSYSSYSWPGNFVDSTITPAAGCDPSLISNGLCKYNRYERFQAVPQSERDNFYAQGTLNIGGGNQAFGEAFYSKIKTDYINAFPYYGDGLAPLQWGNPTTGKPLTFNYLGLLGSDPFNPTGNDGVGFRYRFTDAPSYQNVDSSEYRVLGGLRGTFKDYDWETAVGTMASKTTAREQGNFSSSGFIQEIGDYNNYSVDFNPNVQLNYQSNDPNFFNQPNGYRPGKQNSAAVLNTLFPVFGFSGENKQTWADGKISGSVGFDLPGGPSKFALGGEVRHESYTISPTANLESGDIVGLGISAADSARTTESAYAELNLPILKTLEANLAVRADKYPNLPTHFSPRLSLRYAPTDSVLFRGTIERGFRAPNLIESANSLKFAFDTGTSDPQRCPQATALANDLIAKANSLAPNDPQVAILYARAESVQANECSFGLADEVKNNPNLQPETSRTVSVGMVLEPVKGFTSSVDYWNINRKNTIGLESTAQLLSGAPLPSGVTLNRSTLNAGSDPTFTAAEISQYGVTAGPLQNVIREMENISEQRTSGVDFGFKTSNKTSIGRLSTAMDATYLIGYYDSSISDIHDNLAGQYGYPRYNFSLTVSLDRENYLNSLRLNYIAGTSLQQGDTDTAWNAAACAANNFTPDQCRVKRSQTVDYYFAYTGFKNLTISANILNLFQQRAPADLRAFGVGGIIPTSLQDAEGRMLRLSIDYKFM
ncbi:MAG TPA: TonB-dependent receptor [Burkholderiaceae bacterium]